MSSNISTPCVFELSACLLKDEKGRFLFVKESGRTFHGLWSIPFEKLLPGETPLEAAKRGLLEETGFDGSEIGVRTTYRATNRTTNESFNVHVFQFTVVNKRGDVVLDSTDQRWFSWADFIRLAKAGEAREPGLQIKIITDFNKGRITNPVFPAPEVHFLGNGDYHHAKSYRRKERDLRDQMHLFHPVKAAAFLHPRELKLILPNRSAKVRA